MPASAPAAGVRAARPTISVAGREQASLADGLLSMRVEETVEGVHRCELEVGNWGPAGSGVGFLYFDRRTLDFGKELKIGFDGSAVFNGRVTALEGHFPEGAPPFMTVLAEDRKQQLRMTRRTRTFADKSDADVFQAIARDHSLTADVSLSGPTYKVLTQLNQSDLAFMRERARAVDAELWLDGTTLSVRSHSDRGGASVKLAYGNELREFTALADLAHQRTAVDVAGWDVASRSAIRERAAESILEAELKDGDGGPSVLTSALGERKEVIVDAVPLTSGEARARAEAILRRRARRFVTGRGVAEPNASLRVGASAKLSGLGDLFSGDYYVVRVRHVFDGIHGLRTEFDGERPGLGRPQ
jgi:phage protein D